MRNITLFSVLTELHTDEMLHQEHRIGLIVKEETVVPEAADHVWGRGEMALPGVQMVQMASLVLRQMHLSLLLMLQEVQVSTQAQGDSTGSYTVAAVAEEMLPAVPEVVEMVVIPEVIMEQMDSAVEAVEVRIITVPALAAPAVFTLRGVRP